jgi:hypothetical protein
MRARLEWYRLGEEGLGPVLVGSAWFGLMSGGHANQVAPGLLLGGSAPAKDDDVKSNRQYMDSDFMTKLEVKERRREGNCDGSNR